MDYERQLAKLQKRITKLEQELRTDELTKILNRRGLLAVLRPIFEEVIFEHSNPEKRKNVVVKSLSIVFADIDHFKKINDTFGHAAGDEALKKVAEILKNGTRGIDAVGRWGGEEMILGLLGADKDDAAKVAENLREKIEQTPIILDFAPIVSAQGGKLSGLNATMSLTASFGVAELGKEKTLDALIDRADKALYEAKESGRNKVVVAK
ncbi:MAG TPA: GGDEF domain-containing protein [Candidatus Saccharimonadales bacterium]|nr:GGDEF domain-containing protein [Candidatus Saccharimonadales bacterium]